MIYLISGLGVNEKAFARINLQGRPSRFLPWIKPEKEESYDHYLDRFAKDINPNEEIILIGLSFGGMVAQDLAKRFTVKKIILISSIISDKEFSPIFRFFRMTGLYKLVPTGLLLKSRPILNRIFGNESGKERGFIIDLLKDSNRSIIRWSINAVIHWKQALATPPPNLYRIHGTKDLVFPVKYIGKAHLIKGASHLMIVINASAVNEWLKEVLDK